MNYNDRAKILNQYLYGSWVYGANNPKSDFDYLVVVDGEPEVEEEKIGDRDYHYISVNKFEDLLLANDMKAIECVFAPNNCKYEQFKPEFTFNPSFQTHCSEVFQALFFGGES